MDERGEDLIAALRSALDALIAHREAPRHQGGKVSASVRMDGDPIPTREETFVRHMARDPVEESLILAIRRIGKIAYRRGGTDMMERVCETAADGYGFAGEQYRLNVCSKRWDGIGEWYA